MTERGEAKQRTKEKRQVNPPEKGAKEVGGPSKGGGTVKRAPAHENFAKNESSLFLSRHIYSKNNLLKKYFPMCIKGYKVLTLKNFTLAPQTLVDVNNIE